MAEREFTLPDVAMELPSYVPDQDYWDRGAGPSNAHPFGVEVKMPVKCYVHQPCLIDRSFLVSVYSA